MKRLKIKDKEELLVKSFTGGLEPPEDLMLHEWADKYRVLPRKSSAEHGKWRTSRFPFLKQLMIDLSPQTPVREVTAMKGSQLGFTELCLNRILYNQDVRPVPHLYIQKTLDAISRFSKQRYEPSLNELPWIRDKMRTTKGRGTKDRADTQLIKSFPGGITILGGADSAASLRSAPISDLDVDEWDSFKADIQQEGDPAELAERRTANFPQRKIFRLSTPKTKETSKIEPKFKEGNQQYYMITCPECGHQAPLIWAEDDHPFLLDNLSLESLRCFTIGWDAMNPMTAHTFCQNCGFIIEEKYKTYMMSEENGAHWKIFNVHSMEVSYHISALYSPLGFYSWADAVKLYLKAERTMDRDILKVFTNTVQGKTFSEKGERISAGGILRRREKYRASVPAGVRILTCGTDIQKDRIEAEVVGWGNKYESWSIDYRVFRGNTEYADVWNQLDLYLQTEFEHEVAPTMRPAITMIDSGYRTEQAYKFCQGKEHRLIFPVKGVGGWGKGLFKPPKNRNDFHVFLYTAYPDELKAKFYSQMMTEEPGPNYCHFPFPPDENKDVYNKNHFKQLLAEELRETNETGRVILKWHLPKGRRNEALDCRNYAIVALNVYNPNFELLEKKGIYISGKPQSVKKKKRRRSHQSSIS